MPRTLSIELIASIPWERLTPEQKAATWARLESADLDFDFINGDYDLVGSYRRSELGE